MKSVENIQFDWSEVRESLKTRLGSEVVGRWLEPLNVATVDASTVTLEAPNPFFRDWVSSHYMEAIKAYTSDRTLTIITSTQSKETPRADVSGTAKKEDPQIETKTTSNIVQTKSPYAAANTPQPYTRSEWEKPLNEKYTFDKFVVGPSNRFAHAASLAVAESPAKAYNPLFIYGGVGLGKTHLMQAIGQSILQDGPKKRVVYLSSEGFTNQLITAIQTKKTTHFRERYRNVDVLLIDDIHFIAGKEATQEEFFHTFNSLYDAHKQIIISSDRSPKDIPGLEERLISRFEWGLVTDIQSPDLETRIAILREKAKEAKIDVSDEVTNYIAQQVTSNIRELEGALIRVVAFCNFSNEPQTVDVAQEVLKDMVREVSTRITLSSIQKSVAEYFSVEVNEIQGARRQRSILLPRQIAMFLCRTLTSSSLPEIGRAFGGRDHTTVLHAVNKIEREITQNANIKTQVSQLKERLVLGAKT